MGVLQEPEEAIDKTKPFKGQNVCFNVSLFGLRRAELNFYTKTYQISF